MEEPATEKKLATGEQCCFPASLGLSTVKFQVLQYNPKMLAICWVFLKIDGYSLKIAIPCTDLTPHNEVWLCSSRSWVTFA